MPLTLTRSVKYITAALSNMLHDNVKTVDATSAAAVTTVYIGNNTAGTALCRSLSVWLLLPSLPLRPLKCFY